MSERTFSGKLTEGDETRAREILVAKAKPSIVKEVAGLFDVAGKVAFVPGGSGGIGEAICWGLAASGARVVVAGRSSEKAERLAKQISQAGYEAIGLSVDVKKVSEIRDAASHVVERYGSLDVLMNCAGIQREQALLEVTEEAYDEVYEVNLKAAMFLGQACARHQIKSKRGGCKQIHILSVRSQLGLRGRGYSAYVSSKFGLAGLVKQHAMELAPHKINVNGVAPTFVETNMVKQMLSDDDFRSTLVKRIPLGRIAEPIDLVGPALFFSSRAADFITGQILYVDGGITASQ
jgi:NAD(P)-dependent dehydrogenase (short-subunit alcohol dehydrogenase family)